MSSRRSNRRFIRRRNGRNTRFQGSKTEIIHKPIPRITTINRKVKKVMDMIELKFHDTFFDTAVGNTGEIMLLNSLGQSASARSRIGNEVVNTSLQFRGNITTDPNNVSGTQDVRVIVFWYRQTNGIAPVLFSASGGDALLNNQVVTDLTLAPYMYEYIESYRVLYDKRFTLNPQVIRQTDGSIPNDVTAYGATAKQFKRKIKLNRKTKYDDASTGIGGIATNSLHIAVVSTEPSEEPNVSIGFRLYFKDA